MILRLLKIIRAWINYNPGVLEENFCEECVHCWPDKKYGLEFATCKKHQKDHKTRVPKQVDFWSISSIRFEKKHCNYFEFKV